MHEPTRAGRRSSNDQSPASGGWGPSRLLLGVAGATLAGAVAWAVLAPPGAPVQPASAPGPRAAASIDPAPANPPLAATATESPAAPQAALPARVATRPAVEPPKIPRTRDPNGDLTPDLSDYINEGERPTMAQVIERLHQVGIHGGLGAFSPPGTRPPLVGIAVPEDFELPEGYVRHHQATDDGQPIEPILMFAPGRSFVDASGRPVDIPADRVVPPELAPPGLPIRRIAIPAPADAAGRRGG
ncbi:hypothetical protein JI739_06860 [Ramlibacter sp. AW1]|uniref:Uncharacterized protein n=1 Tax=Ramlibacter aurantiacus TaxID=2801330 RepID=A0A937D2U0_9BURK|nr:hypothetical protein [Ramlibacter aurantiacus]MBL0420065.1 hypothetical protein [Ramlibacter aurantiacus]